MRRPLWTWMEGHTIEGIHGGYIARIWRDGKHGWDMPAAARFVARHWEIEGYGATPDEAIADLRSKYRGRIAEPGRKPA